MTTAQKVIKYLALALAIFLCISIIGGVCAAAVGIIGAITDTGGDALGEMQTYEVGGEISSLSVSISGAGLEIKTADSFSVKSNYNYISVSSENGKLTVSETKKPRPYISDELIVTVSIPKDFIFDEATVKTGAGTVDIDGLAASVLSVSLGAGEASFKNLTATVRAEIEGGAGKMTVDGGLLHNFKLDMGAGELTLKCRITGDSCIDYGMGATHLTLIGAREDYKIKVDKGIGDARLEGEQMQDGSVYGAGENYIEVDGGIGAIDIHFVSE